MDNFRHILVTGSHRSGTTWVGRTIARNPGIRHILEPFSVDYPCHDVDLRLSQWFTHYESSPQKREIRKTFDDLFRPGRVRYAYLRFRKSPRGLERLAHFLAEVIYPPQRPRVLVKDPIALFSADWLYETYDLMVICMIRNPFAFVGSVKEAGWDFDFEVLASQGALMAGPLAPFADEIVMARSGSGDFLDRACLIWNVLHHVIREFQERYPAWLFVRHEDLAKDPISGFESIFDYLGLVMDPAIRRFIEDFTAAKNPESAKTVHFSPRNAKKSLETWKLRLEPEDVVRIGRATRDIGLHFYGDPEDGLPF